MPIYEYHCQNCQADFELMRSMQDADVETACTNCQGTDVKRKLSLFNAASSGRVITGSGGCSGCSGGTCSTCGSN